MKPSVFLRNLEESEVVAAIQEGETKTTGEIRVFVTRSTVREIMPAAYAQFLELGMDRTRDRNAILLFFAPAIQEFAIVGDQAIHQRVGQEGWQAITDAMRGHLVGGHVTLAVITGIRASADLLQKHFPSTDGRPNQFPDHIGRG